MSVVLKGERKIEAGGVTFTLRPERLGDVVLGKQAAEKAGLEVSAKSISPLGFSLIPRITAWEGVSTPDGQPAALTPENIGELFEENPSILMDLINKAFFEEAPASKNSETSQPGSENMTAECVPAVEILPEAAE